MMARVRYIEALNFLYANIDQNLISKGRDSKVPNKRLPISPLNTFQGNYSIYEVNKPDKVSASMWDVENCIFSKLRTFGEIVGKFSGFFWGNFFYFSWIFLEQFFFEDFLRGFFGRNSLFTSLKSAKLFESEIDWCFC